MLFDEEIDVIMPPWGGDFLIEILPYLDFETIATYKPKWIHGYSDISTLLISVTTKLGWATSHGPNILDLASENLDPLTSDIFNVMGNRNFSQSPSMSYQIEWPKWTIHNWGYHPIKGGLLGGCLDTMMRLAGTKYLPIKQFHETIQSKIIWYFESAYMCPEDIFRCMYQGFLLGWFENCAAILIGRISPNTYRSSNIDVQLMVEKRLQWIDVPIITECDVGHFPPQLTLINGALAEITVDRN